MLKITDLFGNAFIWYLPMRSILIWWVRANGYEAIDVISDLQPDIVLLDISLPEISGLELLPIIKQKSPATKVIMLTAKDDEAIIVDALKAGARGYLSKDTSSQGLIKSIKIVHAGDFWIERRLINRILEEHNSAETNSAVVHKKNVKGLTPREQEVLQILAKGYTNKEIAQKLFISEKTVKSHLNNIFKKLEVSRRLEAILYAIKAGLS